MRLSLLLAASLCVMAACKPAAEAPATPAEPAAPAILATPRLETLWTLPGFSDPEGVALAPDGSYFISNVAGEADKFDGQGFISKISPSGEMISLRWSDGLNAPKGMVVLDNVLYVADINRIIKIDASTGARLGDLPVEGGIFLNDVAIWNGVVHVSDSGTGSLIKVVGDKAEYAMNGLYWGAPNGILAQNDGSLVLAAAIAGQLFQVQPDGTQAEIAKGMYQADGIGSVPGGGYLVSSSSGQIHYASPEGVVTTLINTEGPSIAESTSQNDLTVFGDVAIVPNMTRGTVTAHKIKRD